MDISLQEPSTMVHEDGMESGTGMLEAWYSMGCTMLYL